jgi:spermidine synthase
MPRDLAFEKKLLDSKQFVETAQSAWVTSTYPICGVSYAGSGSFCEQMVLGESPTYGKFLATDGELQSTSSDEAIYHEHLVHPSIVAYHALYGKTKPLRVLVLGAGEGATIRELVRYDKETVGYIMWNDIDKDLVDLCEEHLQYVDRSSPLHGLVYNDPERCERRYDDASALLQEETEPYDIVICDLPDPVLEGDIFGLYSPEFWVNMAKRTADQCVISTHTGPIGASKTDMATNLWLQGLVQQSGFSKPLAGKASIPSFLTEWGFIIFTKNTPLESYPGNWDQYLPEGCEVLEQSALTSFFAIPKYYYSRK